MHRQPWDRTAGSIAPGRAAAPGGAELGRRTAARISPFLPLQAALEGRYCVSEWALLLWLVIRGVDVERWDAAAEEGATGRATLTRATGRVQRFPGC